MKIIDKRNDENQLRFEDLEPGDIFEFPDEEFGICIVINNGGKWFSLSERKTEVSGENAKVRKLNAVLTIEAN